MSRSSGEIRITEFEIEGGNLRILLEDSEKDFNLFILQGSTELLPGSWADLPSALLTPIDSTQYELTLARSDADSEFFRVMGLFLDPVLDPDGDGLPAALEELLGTDIEKFDTDEDGFSDGVEYAYGTDPAEASSQPTFVSLPTVNFVGAHSTGREGINTPYEVEIVFDRYYSGIVNYEVDPLGNTTAGTDFSLSEISTATTGSVTVEGFSAMIPLTIIDDTNVSGQRVVIIDLKLNEGNYFIGGKASHVVLLEDNDAWWTGSLIPASGESDGRIFRLKIARQGNTTTATFGAGAGQDGLPVPVVEDDDDAPLISSTSISNSIIPEGTWPSTVNADAPNHISVDSPELPIPAGSLFPNEQIRRTLQLNAQVSLNGPGHPHVVERTRYIGDSTETLVSSTGTPIAAFPGNFVLIRDTPTPLPVLTNLIPSAP